MIYKIAKYTLLLLFAFLALYQFFPTGDYCVSGMMIAFMWLFFGGLFVLAFIIFLVIDITRNIRKKTKFDIIPTVLMVGFILLNLVWINNLEDNSRMWKDIQWKGTLRSEAGDGDLMLYTDGTFDAKCQYTEHSCYFFGAYSIENNKLTLVKNDLEELTDHRFTAEYFVHGDSLFVPVDSVFGEIFKVVGDTED